MDVIVVQSEGAVQFLALAPSLLAWNVMEQLVLLDVFIRADVANHTAVGIVVIDLHNAVILRDDHTIVVPFGHVREKALMILQIEIVGRVSGAAEGVISVVGQSHRKIVVGEYGSVYVVRRRRYAYARRLVRNPQLRSAGTIDIVDDPSVAVGDAARKVQVIIPSHE